MNSRDFPLHSCGTPHQEGEPADNRPFKDWVLQKETELRLEVGGDQDAVDIRVSKSSYTIYTL